MASQDTDNGERHSPPSNSEVLRNIQTELTAMRKLGENTEASIHDINMDIRDTILPRLHRLWDAVFGVQVENHNSPGLVDKVDEIIPVIHVVKNGIVIAKWLTVTFIGATIVGIANLLVITNNLPVLP